MLEFLLDKMKSSDQTVLTGLGLRCSSILVSTVAEPAWHITCLPCLRGGARQDNECSMTWKENNWTVLLACCCLTNPTLNQRKLINKLTGTKVDTAFLCFNAHLLDSILHIANILYSSTYLNTVNFCTFLHKQYNSFICITVIILYLIMFFWYFIVCFIFKYLLSPFLMFFCLPCLLLCANIPRQIPCMWKPTLQ